MMFPSHPVFVPPLPSPFPSVIPYELLLPACRGAYAIVFSVSPCIGVLYCDKATTVSTINVKPDVILVSSVTDTDQQ